MKKNMVTPIILGLIFCLAGTVSSQIMNHHQDAVFDFDGDKISDQVMIENVNSNLTWHILQSRYGMVTVQFGSAERNDIAVPADYDGDGLWDVAIWRPTDGLWQGHSAFWILSSRDGSISTFPWGLEGDNPRITQDFDGDGKADPAIVRRTNGAMEWWVMLSTGGISAATFGKDSDYVVRGDFDGDNRADLAVYRTVKDATAPANTFIITQSSDQSTMFTQFGMPGDMAVPGDFDGDGSSDIAVFRANATDLQAMWYWISSRYHDVRMMPFGMYLDRPGMDCPAPGDYDKDGATDIALWRMIAKNPNAEFHQLITKGGEETYVAFPFGDSHMEVPNFTMQVADTNHPQ
jgi:hypothetical protein